MYPGYKQLLNNLNKTKGNNIEVGSFTFDDSVYVVFLESVQENRLLGIIKSSNSSIEKMQKLNESYLEKGFKLSSLKFKNGKLC